MNIACVQMHCRFGEVDTNLDNATALIESVEADLYVLPELFNTGYLFQSEHEINRLAEPANGKTAEVLTQVAKARQAWIVAGFAEKSNNAIYNSAMLVGPHGLVDIYRKAHLFDSEKLWFTPGDTPFSVIDVGSARLGLMICFDWIFPESMRSLALLGADIVCHPSNLVMPYCQKAMVTRCLENQVYAITANRSGADRRPDAEIAFTGQSQITAPRGEILASATEVEETVLVADINVQEARDKHINPRNDLFSDRRPDVYSL